MTDFMNYFTEHTEYPFGSGLPTDLLPMGELYEYVSGTFLNGLVNYGKRLDIELISRYLTLNEKFETENKMLTPPNEPFVRKDISFSSKQEILNLFQEGWRSFHFSLDVFQDDIAILFRQDDHYLFMYFDQDVSDCMIGRFQTEDTEEVVIQRFRDWANSSSQSNNKEDSVNIPLSWIEGWISF